MLSSKINSIEKQSNHLWLHSLLLLVFCVGLLSSNCYASDTNTILVVLSKNSRPYQEFASALKENAGNSESDALVNMVFIQLGELDSDALLANSGKDYRLVVTVGSAAVRKILPLKLSVPIVSTLIPKRTYDVVRKKNAESANNNTSAIFLDQPAERKFGLIRAALPDMKNVGVIVGPSTKERVAELDAAARNKNINLDAKKIADEDGLLDALNELLENSEILLTVADPAVVNRNTLQSVFMTSYMKRIPVIAYSRAYVRAGALMAVYSTPAQIGLQTGELLMKMAQTDSWKSQQSYYPKYFSVAVNDRVARSLGLLIKDHDQIQSAMKVMEGTQ